MVSTRSRMGAFGWMIGGWSRYIKIGVVQVWGGDVLNRKPTSLLCSAVMVSGLFMNVLFAPSASADSPPSSDPFGDYDDFSTGLGGWSYEAVGWSGPSPVPGSYPPGHDGSAFGSFSPGGVGGTIVRQTGFESRTDLVVTMQFWGNCPNPCVRMPDIYLVVYGTQTLPPNTIKGGYAFELTTAPGAWPQLTKWVGGAHVPIGWADQTVQLQLATLYNIKFVVAGHYLYGYLDDKLVATAIDGEYTTPFYSFEPESSSTTVPFNMEAGPTNEIGMYSHGTPGSFDKFRIVRNTAYVKTQADRVQLFQGAWSGGQNLPCNTGAPSWIQVGPTNQIKLRDCGQAIRLRTSSYDFSDFVLEFNFHYVAANQNAWTPRLTITYGSDLAATTVSNQGINFRLDGLNAQQPGSSSSLDYCAPACQHIDAYPLPQMVSVPPDTEMNHVKLVKDGFYSFVYINGVQVAAGKAPGGLTGNHATIWLEQFQPSPNDGVWVDDIMFSIKGQGDDFGSGALQAGWTVDHGVTQFPQPGGTLRLTYPIGGPQGYTRVSIRPPEYLGASGFALSAHVALQNPLGVGPSWAALIFGRVDAVGASTWTQFEFGDAGSPGFYSYSLVKPCAVQCGTFVGHRAYDSPLPWGGAGQIHEVRVTEQLDEFSGVYHLLGWIDGQVVATLETSTQPRGYFGMASKENTQVDFDDMQVALDTDVDGAIDTEEINGHNAIREAAVYQVLDVGQYFLQIPLPGGTGNFAFAAKAPRGGFFDVSIRLQNGQQQKGTGAQLAGPQGFYGAGAFAVYVFTPSHNFVTGDLFVDFTFVGKNFDSDLVVAWVGMISNSFGGHRAAFTVAGNAEGLLGSGNHYPGCPTYCTFSDLTYTDLLVRETMQWELNDFDNDKMADSREARMYLKTSIPYGFVVDGNWGHSTSDYLIWEGVKYQCVLNQQGQACQSYSDTAVSGWDLMAVLSDKSEIRYQRTAANNKIGLRDHLHVAGNPQGAYYVFQPVADSQQSWGVDDNLVPGEENGRSIMGPFDHAVTNQRWAILQIQLDDSIRVGGKTGMWLLLDAFRSVLVNKLGYLERNNNASTPDSSGIDPYADHVITVFNDGTDAQAIDIFPSNVDVPDGKSYISNVFSYLYFYIGQDDSVLVMVFAHGDVESDTGSSHFGEGYTWSHRWYDDQPMGDEKNYESTWNSNLNELALARQVVFVSQSSHGGALLDTLAAPGRAIVLNEKEEQLGRWTDNTASNDLTPLGVHICESDSCEHAGGVDSQGHREPDTTDDDAFAEMGYYEYGALSGATLYDNDYYSDMSVGNDVFADFNRNGIVSVYEMWKYAQQHNSWTSTVYPYYPDVWMDPQFDDDGVSPSSSPSGHDGLRAQNWYL
jgi:hypothetical protein